MVNYAGRPHGAEGAAAHPWRGWLARRSGYRAAATNDGPVFSVEPLVGGLTNCRLNEGGLGLSGVADER
jgi:hypothetical protein